MSSRDHALPPRGPHQPDEVRARHNRERDERLARRGSVPSSVSAHVGPRHSRAAAAHAQAPNMHPVDVAADVDSSVPADFSAPAATRTHHPRPGPHTPTRTPTREPPRPMDDIDVLMATLAPEVVVEIIRRSLTNARSSVNNHSTEASDSLESGTVASQHTLELDEVEPRLVFDDNGNTHEQVPQPQPRQVPPPYGIHEHVIEGAAFDDESGENAPVLEEIHVDADTHEARAHSYSHIPARAQHPPLTSRAPYTPHDGDGVTDEPPARGDAPPLAHVGHAPPRNTRSPRPDIPHTPSPTPGRSPVAFVHPNAANRARDIPVYHRSPPHEVPSASPAAHDTVSAQSLPDPAERAPTLSGVSGAPRSPVHPAPFVYTAPPDMLHAPPATRELEPPPKTSAPTLLGSSTNAWATQRHLNDLYHFAGGPTPPTSSFGPATVSWGYLESTQPDAARAFLTKLRSVAMSYPTFAMPNLGALLAPHVLTYIECDHPAFGHYTLPKALAVISNLAFGAAAELRDVRAENLRFVCSPSIGSRELMERYMTHVQEFQQCYVDVRGNLPDDRRAAEKFLKTLPKGLQSYVKAAVSTP